MTSGRACIACLLSSRGTLARSAPLILFFILFVLVPPPEGASSTSGASSSSSSSTRGGGGPALGGRGAYTTSATSGGGSPRYGAHPTPYPRCPAGPYLAPNGHDPFVFPPDPLGVTLPVPPPSQPWVDWRDDAALFLGTRGEGEARAGGGPFFRNLHGRPNTHLFDTDLTLTLLSTYGHFLPLQRPNRYLFPWHTGEFKDRRHTLPFITGDAFRQLADFYCDNEPTCRALPSHINNASHPVYARLKPQQSIIVFATCQDVHILLDAEPPLLATGHRDMVIVVHNGDMALEAGHAHYLDHPRLTAYFTQNCAIGGPLPHRKLVCIPIGLEPRQFSMHGWRPETLMGSMVAAIQGRSPLEALAQPRFAFAAWSVGTYRAERAPLLESLEAGGAHHALHVEGEPEPPPDPERPRVVPSNAPPGPFSFVTIGGGGAAGALPPPHAHPRHRAGTQGQWPGHTSGLGGPVPGAHGHHQKLHPGPRVGRPARVGGE